MKLSFGDYWNAANGSGLLFGLNASHYRFFHINGALYYDINGMQYRIIHTMSDALKTDYFVCRLNNFNMYINNVLVTTGIKYNGTLSQEGKYLKLFMNTSDSQYAKYSFKGYYDYLKIYNESGELIHELRMRDTTEVWDVITNKVYPCISLLA